MHEILVLARQKRNDCKIKIKVPLRSMQIIHRDSKVIETIKPLQQYIMTELNIKNISYSCDESNWIDYDIKPNSPILGKRFGKQFPHYRKLIAAMTLEEISILEEEGSIKLDDQEFTQQEILLYRKAKENTDVVAGRMIAITLDTNIDHELKIEGLAREVVNRVQKTRKEMCLDVDNRINITFAASGDLAKAISCHAKYIADETLALDIKIVDKVSSDISYDIEGHTIEIALEKVEV